MIFLELLCVFGLITMIYKVLEFYDIRLERSLRTFYRTICLLFSKKKPKKHRVNFTANEVAEFQKAFSELGCSLEDVDALCEAAVKLGQTETYKYPDGITVIF